MWAKENPAEWYSFGKKFYVGVSLFVHVVIIKICFAPFGFQNGDICDCLAEVTKRERNPTTHWWSA